MYRLGTDLAHFLITNRKSEQLPPVGLSELKPFEPRNLRSIGFIDPICAVGTSLDYCIECPAPMMETNIPYAPVLDGYWLYRRDELKRPTEPISLERKMVDPTGKDSDEILDVTDCAIVLPSDIDKLTCKTITTLEKLLEVEPGIKECLKEGTI